MAEPGEGIKTLPLRTARQAEEDGGSASTSVAATKHPIFATDRAGLHGPLGQVVVDGQFTVFAVANECRPIVEGISGGCADA